MAFMRTSNPALNQRAFQVAGLQSETMTLPGVVNKTGILLVCTAVTAIWSWQRFAQAPDQVWPVVAVGGIGGFIVALVTIFKKEWSPVTAPLYALLEGLFLGAISASFEAAFHGIVIQAVVLTFGTLFALLIAYRSGLIKVTENFKLGVVAATGGIALLYLIEIGLGFFGIQFASINGAGPIGIGFSVFVVIIAALNLVLDFDFIESGVNSGAPKYMEWYAAFGLMVTLIWLYLEILRLLSKLRRR